MNEKKMTLQHYYNSLPDRKKEFRDWLQSEFNLSERTLYYWISFPWKIPDKYRDHIAKKIGISKDQLFQKPQNYLQ